MRYKLPKHVDLPPEWGARAKNLYTRMAIYVDHHIYDDKHRNDELLYQYIYHIICMLSGAKKLFDNNLDTIDEFAIYLTNIIYCRYLSKDYLKKRGKIKSILNYCKALIGPAKINFQQVSFNSILGPTRNGKQTNLGERIRDNLEESIQSDNFKEKGVDETTIEFLNAFSKDIEDIVIKSIKFTDKIIQHRLYISVLLSIINSITIQNKDYIRLQHRDDKGMCSNDLILNLYTNEFNNCVILWKLSSKYTNLVKFLVVKVMSKCYAEICKIKTSSELSVEELDCIINSAYDSTKTNDYSEDM